MSKNKQLGNLIDTQQKQEVQPMSEFPIVLEDSILKWQNKMREATGNRFFNGYQELSKLVGLAPSTIRSYTDQFTLTTPTVENLIKICLAIRDNTPLEFLNEYQRALFL